MRNKEAAKILSEIAIYLEMMNENVFKVRAYEKAAQTIDSMSDDIGEIYKKGGPKALEEIPGIGKGIAEKLEEFITTDKIKFYEELKKKTPVDISSLLGIEGLGPKKIKILYHKLKIKNIGDLEKAALKGRIRNIPGFGEKTEHNILKGIEFAKQSRGRLLLGEVLPIAMEIEEKMSKLSYVDRIVVAGSIRRRKETIGDADVLVVSKRPEKVMDYFVSMPEVARVYGKGRTKSMIKLRDGLGVDLRVVPAESFGAALNYFTGSKDHNIAMRRIAISKGLKLSEYGVFRGEKQVAGKTEGEVYELLGLRYIEPEMRENTGEIESAKRNKLPHLIGYNDLKGDMQTQTRWTDGNHSIEEMALEARRIGLEYIAITDHTKSLAMTGGLDEKKLEKQGKEIDAINRKTKGFTILKGAEVNIMKDGSLDIADSALKKLDVVGASVHSLFNLPRAEQTRRIIKAMNNPNVDIIFHPTGRVLKKREPYDVDIEALIDAAKDTDTVLEIDAFPDRLDLKDEHIRMAVKAGVKLSIDSDAHSKSHMRFLEFGISQARRGWAEKKDIINAWPLEKTLKMLK